MGPDCTKMPQWLGIFIIPLILLKTALKFTKPQTKDSTNGKQSKKDFKEH